MKRARIGTRTDRQGITILLLLRPDGDGLHLLQKSRRHRLNCLLLSRNFQMVLKYATRFNRCDLWHGLSASHTPTMSTIPALLSCLIHPVISMWQTETRPRNKNTHNEQQSQRGMQQETVWKLNRLNKHEFYSTIKTFFFDNSIISLCRPWTRRRRDCHSIPRPSCRTSLAL